ncbi:30S ribosomal protein THX [Luteimonas sp. e5]
MVSQSAARFRVAPQHSRSISMGKGDRKTAKGKRYNSSYGNARPKAVTKASGSAAAPVAKKASGRKVVAKKATKPAA